MYCQEKYTNGEMNKNQWEYNYSIFGNEPRIIIKLNKDWHRQGQIQLDLSTINNQFWCIITYGQIRQKRYNFKPNFKNERELCESQWLELPPPNLMVGSSILINPIFGVFVWIYVSGINLQFIVYRSFLIDWDLCSKIVAPYSILKCL